MFGLVASSFLAVVGLPNALSVVGVMGLVKVAKPSSVESKLDRVDEIKAFTEGVYNEIDDSYAAYFEDFFDIDPENEMRLAAYTRDHVPAARDVAECVYNAREGILRDVVEARLQYLGCMLKESLIYANIQGSL